MAQTTRFIDGKKSVSKEIDIIQTAVLDGAQLKTGKKKSLPEHEAVSTMIYTQDTGEIFMGQGGNAPIKKLSDVEVLNSINDLPTPGVENRLYIAKDMSSIHYWNGSEYKTLGLGGTTGQENVDALVNAITATNATANDAKTVAEKAGDDAAASNANAAAAKAIAEKARDDISGAKTIAEKAGKDVAIAKAAAENADSNATAAKEIAVKAGNDAAAIKAIAEKAGKDANTAKTAAEKAGNDAAAVKVIAEKAGSDAAAVKAIADKAEADAIAAAKVAADNKAACDQAALDIAALKKEDARLDAAKAEKADLDLYRKKADVIAEADLDTVLVDLIKKGSSGVAYDDKAVKDRLTKLEADIISKRDATDDVEESDLNQALATKVNAATAVEARVKTLEDAKYATLVYTEATYVKKTDKISKSQLEDAIASDLNKIPGMETLINSLNDKVKALETTVADLKANAPVKKTQVISVESLSIDPGFYSPAYETPFSTVVEHLPKTAAAKLSDGTSKEMSIVWRSSTYVPTKVGAQTIEGDIVTTDTIGNNAGFVAKCTVTVAEQQAATWEYRFSTSLGVQRVNLSDIHPGLTFTEEEFLGETETSPRAVKVYMIDNTTGTEVLKEVPARDALGNLNGPSPDSTLRNGAVRFSPDANQNGGAIIFDNGSDYTVNYLIRKQPI